MCMCKKFYKRKIEYPPHTSLDEVLKDNGSSVSWSPSVSS
ncbi:hypothetical protein NSE_0076 [Neorickettsia sennetsu str. Miyayama]|uniref:Uncharacterized protein n=1 Tax=Ehrlichia sennetsu (strain ATCC VR-367 / Miyayama) TaxID=222891 RepID=Q2GEW9_EHRS3|nr:hypothetical protein NSE_0076 [Neorickettsia sennetsu str. Miyayama]